MASATTVCPHCGGTGWRIHEKGGLSGAERCDCFKVQRAERLLAAANIPENYKNSSFDTFLISRDDKQMEDKLSKAYLTAHSYADRYPHRTDKPGLLLLGPTGTGKTHLAVSVMRRLAQRGFETVFFDYQELLEDLRSSYDPSYGAALRESYQRALECQVLVLDDLGAYRVSDWVLDTVTHLITVRCNDRRAVIATTNFSDSTEGLSLGPQLGGTEKKFLWHRIGERARSRLKEMCTVIRMDGVSDYRERPPAR